MLTYQNNESVGELSCEIPEDEYLSSSFIRKCFLSITHVSESWIPVRTEQLEICDKRRLQVQFQTQKLIIMRKELHE